MRTWRGPLATLVIVIVWWELLARSGWFNPLFIPSVADIGSAFARLFRLGLLVDSTVTSLGRLFLGVGIAAVVGIA